MRAADEAKGRNRDSKGDRQGKLHEGLPGRGRQVPRPGERETEGSYRVDIEERKSENLQETGKIREISSAADIPGMSADSQSNALVFSALPSGYGRKRPLRQGCSPRSEE